MSEGRRGTEAWEGDTCLTAQGEAPSPTTPLIWCCRKHSAGQELSFTKNSMKQDHSNHCTQDIGPGH